MYIALRRQAAQSLFGRYGKTWYYINTLIMEEEKAECFEAVCVRVRVRVRVRCARVCVFFWGLLVLWPAGCTRDLCRSLRSRGSMRCRYRLGDYADRVGSTVE